MNAGTCSPTSHAVLDALQRWHVVKAEDPVHFTFRIAPVLVEVARRELAAYLGCEARCLILLNNATFAANTLARSLPWQAGDEILLSSQEYHHYLTLWRRVADERGVTLKVVPLPTRAEEPGLTPAAILARFAAAATPKTRAVFASHVTSATGLALPVAALVALAREKAWWSLIDGAHAPGLLPVDLRALAPDFYFANVHKWMMGATGSAFLYVRDELRPLVKPLVTTEAFALAAAGPIDEELAGGVTRWCQSHEYQGTRDLVPLVVIPEALRFLREVSPAEVAERTHPLTVYSVNRLKTAGLELVSHEHPELRTCMLAFKVPAGGAFSPTRASLYFRQEEQFEIGTPHLNDQAKTPLLRVSCAWFNTTADIDALAASLTRVDWARLRA